MTSAPIRSNNRHQLWIMWLAALVWTGLCVLLLHKVTAKGTLLDRETGEVVMVLLFFAGDAFILGVTTYATWTLLRFGPSPLFLDPNPGSIGGQVGGYASLTYPFLAEQVFTVQVNCIRSRVSKSSNRRSRSESVLWQTDGACRVEKIAGATRLAFSFDIPPDLPASDLKKSADYHLWRIEIAADLDGPDFHRSFDIPVLGGEPRHSGIERPSVQKAANLDAALAGIETVANIRAVPRGIEAEFPALGRPGQGIFLILFGLTFSGIGLTLALGGLQLFVGLAFTLMGLPIMSAGLHYIGKSLLVSVTDEGLKARRFLFGYPLATRSLAAGKIQALEVVKKGSMTSGNRTQVYYQLSAKGADGVQLTVAERLVGRSEADVLRESFIAYLGISLPDKNKPE